MSRVNRVKLNGNCAKAKNLIGNRIAAVSISAEEIAREKDRLPRGWGRFGKSLDELAELSEPDESLISSCVAINPEFKHKTVTLPGGLIEMTSATNIVLGATNKRLLLVGTGMGGAPRNHYDLSYEGLEIADRRKKEFTLRTEHGEIRFRGAAKQQIPEFLDAVEANVR